MASTFTYYMNALLNSTSKLDIEQRRNGDGSGTTAGCVAIGDDAIFVAGARTASNYQRGWVAKLERGGALLWAVNLNDASGVADTSTYKCASVHSMVPTAGGGVVAVMDCTTTSPSAVIPRFVCLIELSATGTIVRQSGFYGTCAAAPSTVSYLRYAWTWEIRPYGTGYRVLGKTTLSSANYTAPLIFAVNASLAPLSGATHWATSSGLLGIYNRTFGPSHLGSSTAAFAPNSATNAPCVVKLSGLGGIASGIWIPTLIQNVNGSMQTSDGGVLLWGSLGLTKLDSTLAVEWSKRVDAAGSVLAAVETDTGYCFMYTVSSGSPNLTTIGSLGLDGEFQWAYRVTPASGLEFYYLQALMAFGQDGVTLVTRRDTLTPNQLRVSCFPSTGEKRTCTIFGDAVTCVITDVAITTTAFTANDLLTEATHSFQATTSYISAVPDTGGVGAIVCTEAEVNPQDPGPPDPVVEQVDRSFLLVLSEDSGGWMVWRGLGDRGAWNPEENRPLFLGGDSIYRAWQRGGRFVSAFLTLAYSDLGSRDRVKSPRHLEIDATGDGGTVTVDWEQEGDLQSSAVGTLTPPTPCFSTDAADGYFSDDKAGGVFRKVKPQIQRIWKATAQRGELTRVTLSFLSRLDLTIHRLFLNFAVRNPPGGSP